MAYMDQEKKAKIAALVKPILKKYGVKATLSVRDYRSICLNIQSSGIDFFGDITESCQRNYMQVNPYWYNKNFKGKSLEFFSEVIPVLYSVDYYNRSDSMTDYFDVAYYVDVNVGKWNKPYVLTK